MGYSFLMNMLPRLSGWFLLTVTLALFGCANAGGGAKSLKNVQKVYVADPVAATLPETTALNAAVHDVAVRELSALGYGSALTSQQADAVLKSTWHTRLDDNGRSIVSLSVTLFDKAGHKLYSSDSGAAVVSSFWSESRVTTELATMLGTLPHAGGDATK